MVLGIIIITIAELLFTLFFTLGYNYCLDDKDNSIVDDRFGAVTLYHYIP